MWGAYSYSASLFTTVKLEDIVPANHALRPIRSWVNDAPAKMDAKFSAMCEADVKGGRPSPAPEKLMRDILLQVLYSVRSELLSGEHFSVDGTLIHAWASHKSMRRKDGSDDGRPPEDWCGEPRSNNTHESTSDPVSRLYRKSTATPALPSYLGHVLTDNRHGLMVNAQASTSDGTADRHVAEQMLVDIADPGKRETVGADKAYDTKGFVKACRDINVTPHVAQNLNRNGGNGIDRRTTRHLGNEASQRMRKRIEQRFGWGKLIGPIRQVMVQRLEKADQLLTLTMAAHDLTRLRTMAQLRPQCVQFAQKEPK